MIDLVFTQFATYDSKGNVLTSGIAFDFNNDGVNDYIDTATSTYDSKGNMLSMSDMGDYNNDGVIEIAPSATTAPIATAPTTSMACTRMAAAASLPDHRRPGHRHFRYHRLGHRRSHMPQKRRHYAHHALIRIFV